MSETITEMPAMYRHCLETYEAMENNAQFEDIEGHESVLVWKGFLTKLICKELSHSVPYFTKIMQNLKRMDCVRQLQRGGGSAHSHWALLQKPTPELWEAHHRQPEQTAKTLGNARMDVIEQQMRDLTRMVQDISDNQGTITLLVDEIQRLNGLESE
jgi:hypothetical protein